MIPTRPALRYHGGKWRLAPWVVSHFPQHRVYVEPFCGAASVLLRKQRTYTEIINDMDAHVTSLFRILRDPDRAAELIRRLELTPYSRAEFEASYEPTVGDLEAARKLIVRSWMAFNSRGTTSVHRTGFRGAVGDRGTHSSRDWARFPHSLKAVVERLQGVLIECRPAVEVIKRYDAPDAVIYCDPPYVHETRGDAKSGRAYRHEMTDEDHVALAEVLNEAAGFVLVSGYETDLYRELFAGWKMVKRKAQIDNGLYSDTSQFRTECLWLSPRTTDATPHPKLWD